MNKKKKIIIAVILIIIFALCFIPPKSTNSKYKLEIVSTYGDNEAYHPKVISFMEKWNGYKYWMSYTPYPKGDDSKENPHIAVSNDLINWKAHGEFNGSLDDISNDGIKEKYNSDSHIVYNTDTNELECYWRFVDDINNKCVVYRRDTKDGKNWTPKKVTAYSDNRSQKKDYVSPAIIYQNKQYKMWYVDKENKVIYATSTDGVKWEDKQEIEIKYDKKLLTWHIDVIYTEKGYEMIAVAYDKWANRNDMSLYYTISKDGINWNKAITIMKPTVKTTNWDNKGIYRSSFIFENGNYYVFYSGTNKSYNHGIGLVYGEDITKLKSVDINYKDQEQVRRLIKKINKS